uniref:Uncharacterized protein n=1 Tax=Romanomermis culicivorax TaxID=13658 RepID=A0A915HZ73_ROMCU
MAHDNSREQSDSTRTLDMAKFQRNHLSLPLTHAKTTAMMQQQLDDVGQQIEQQCLELECLRLQQAQPLFTIPGIKIGIC